MASIRRTLSPVPRSGVSMNGEACGVASPLSRSLPMAQSNRQPSEQVSSPYAQGAVLGFFSPRSSRPLEKKLKGALWRRALFHFSICFMVGMFIGLTPFALPDIFTNSMSKHNSFYFDLNTAVGNFQSDDIEIRNVTRIDSETTNNSSMLDAKLNEKDPKTELTSSEDSNMTSVAENEVMGVRKLLIVVTPTETRPLQAYYLTRLAYTLKHVGPPLLWIVVETNSQSQETAEILRNTGIMYRHVVCEKNLTGIKERSIHQRNAALAHIERHHLDGILTFADEDSIYMPDLFEKMRTISRFGTWMVATVIENERRTMLEGPICNGTEVVGWHTSGVNKRIRRFHADMAGFSFNSTILWDSKRWHRPTPEPIRQLDSVRKRFQVSAFIEQLVEDESQMECLLENSSKIMVWRLHLETSVMSYPHNWLLKNNMDVMLPLANIS